MVVESLRTGALERGFRDMGRRVTAGPWKLYRVTHKKVYSGELKDYLIRGMEFEYNGSKLRINNQEIIAPNIRGMIRKGWVADITDEEPEEEAPPPQSFLDRAIAAKEKSVKVLPDGWSQLHWRKKMKFVQGCEDVKILQNIRRAESNKVKYAAESRIEELEEGHPVEPAPKVRRGPAPSVDAESPEDLARAVGAEITPTGEDTATGADV